MNVHLLIDELRRGAAEVEDDDGRTYVATSMEKASSTMGNMVSTLWYWHVIQSSRVYL